MTRGRWLRAGDALSQLGNVLLFNGEADGSISGDAYRYGRRRLKSAIDKVFSLFERDHCRRAYFADRERARKLLEEIPPCP